MNTRQYRIAGSVLLALVMVSIAGCGGEAPPEKEATKTTVSATPTTPVLVPTLTIQATPIPTHKVATRMVPPTPLPTVVTKRTTLEIDWGGICPPSPEKEGQVVANLEMGSTVEIEGYLYVKSTSIKRDEAMVFTLRAVSYYGTGWSRECRIHVFVPIGTGPNHVGELPKKFKFTDVVVWDKDGREIRGWERSLDGYHVHVTGQVVKAYGGATGLSGSNTIRLTEITLLE